MKINTCNNRNGKLIYKKGKLNKNELETYLGGTAVRQLSKKLRRRCTRKPCTKWRCSTRGSDAATVAEGAWCQRRRRVVAVTVAGRETKEWRDDDRRCNKERVRVRVRLCVVVVFGGGWRWSKTLVAEVV